MTHTRQSIGKEKAIALFKSGWWKNKTSRDVAEFQMLTDELCMPFGDFHAAVEKTLGRPVFTHEFGLDYDGLVKELFGERPAPTFDDILSMIPDDKRIVVII